MRALALLLVLPVVVRSHPGAIAEGRASCGAEYGTASAAYLIPDVREAWFVRRIATCEAPVFWTMFDITQEQQELYIAVITPELPRFKDRLVFNGILYGPGVSASLDGLSSLPTNLPAGVTLATNLGDAAYIKSPSSLAECGFVDTNPVMRHYSDVIRGRCMEELRLDASYEDALQADTTSYSWWLYSFNHVAAKPGKYYLQTWLADPASGAVAQGKYEITLAPWSWAGYASKDTQALAQSQGTSCSCSPNALAYKEQDIARLGDLEPALFAAQLPGGSCSAAPQPNTACSAQAREPKLSANSAVEWAGLFRLTRGRTYRLTLPFGCTVCCALTRSMLLTSARCLGWCARAQWRRPNCWCLYLQVDLSCLFLQTWRRHHHINALCVSRPWDQCLLDSRCQPERGADDTLCQCLSGCSMPCPRSTRRRSTPPECCHKRAEALTRCLPQVSKEADQALKQGLAKMDSVSENDTLNLRRAQVSVQHARVQSWQNWRICTFSARGLF